MLRYIPKHPRQITAKELIDHLKYANFEVSKRTVERDLLSLSEIFALISNERSRPYGWSWSKDADPQFEEVAQMVIKSRSLEDHLSYEETELMGRGVFCFSDQLIAETRKAIYDMPITRDDYLHFKNWNGRFGKISKFDLMEDKLLMKDKNTGTEYFYKSTDELIDAGWGID